MTAEDTARDWLTRAQVRELDRRAWTSYAIPAALLMENAARSAASVCEELLAHDRGGETVVLCGPGNNGGDGFALARTLVDRGHRARVVFCGERAQLARLSEEAAQHARWWEALGEAWDCHPNPAAEADFARRVADAPLVVDALFGTGLSRALAAPWADLVELVGERAVRVLALDLPSGLDADSGEVLGAALTADLCVTFVARKRGLCSGAGPALAGRVVVAEIGLPAPLLREFGLEPARLYRRC